MPVAEIAPGLVRLEARIGGGKPLFQHVIMGQDAWLWFDTGIASTPDEALLDRLSWQLTARHVAVISHADVDHFGGLGRLRAAIPGLVVISHARDARWIGDLEAIMAERYLAHIDAGMDVAEARQRQLRHRAGLRVAPDIHLVGGETFDLGPAGRWRVLALPGHSPGSIGLWEESLRVALIGDAVLGWGVVDGDGRRTPPPYGSVSDYLATIATLEDLGVERLFAAHEPERSGPEIGAWLAESRAAVGEIGAAVRAAARAGVARLPDVCERVGRDLGRWPDETWPGLADAVESHRREEAPA
ncbi:MAG: MBL fold metallo-hydrolase [Chloroflexi bacterium]|nr:MBL fold metallo-hydrolase [Chloroflexota bacterium]